MNVTRILSWMNAVCIPSALLCGMYMAHYILTPSCSPPPQTRTLWVGLGATRQLVDTLKDPANCRHTTLVLIC